MSHRASNSDDTTALSWAPLGSRGRPLDEAEKGDVESEVHSVGLIHFDRRPLAELYSSFRWPIPDVYNIGIDVCDKWASDPERLALIDASDRGTTRYTFADLARRSNRWANALSGLGVGRGDRVAIILSQRPETPIAHIAT